MTPRYRRTTAGLALFIAATLFAHSAVPAGGGEKESAPAAELDFSETAAGEEPAGLFVVDGKFVAALEGEKTVLELKPEPLVEGLVLAGDTLRGGGSIRARVHAAKRGRSYPRFGVGLHGISGYRLRVVPARKAIEIYKDDEVVKEKPFAWKDGSWTWLELSVVAAEGEDRWRVEARVWLEGEEKPDAAQLSVDVEGGRFTGKGVLSGTPYSGTPIRFDRILVAPEQG